MQSSGLGSGTPLGLLSESSFTQLVNEAFRQYQSTLALSRSALANSALVTPTLVLDEASPTAEERGRGLRLVLRWAVEQIAPASIVYPIGTFRPFDDPTWSDPLWWRYNILRHRYLEPLHPDDFVEGGRFTETLMAFTGISSSDAFFDERNRAIREVADHLRQQLMDGAANQSLQQMALTEIVQLLAAHSEATTLLGIAAVFDDIFPRALLLAMAEDEQLQHGERALHYLIKHRLILVGDDQHQLLLSTTLRSYFNQKQPAALLQRRHRAVARFYSEHEEPLLTARHALNGGQAERAANILFDHAESLVNELQIADLLQVLLQFSQRTLGNDTWRELQILLSDLYYRSGQPEDAVAACRRALQVAEEAADQARIYRRLGKIYVTRNQLHALTYYQQAAERFDPASPELADLMKDRGWLHILRRNWLDAERDLTLALAIAQESDAELQADIVDALASLYRRQDRFDVALEQARRALSIRESLGNLPRIASSFNNLGNIYRDMGEYWHAISAYEDALVTYQKLGNAESIAGALLNIGMAHHLLQEYARAVELYSQCLTICQEQTLPHIEANVRYNLAETYAALEQAELARAHWQRGYILSQQAGFTDEIHAYEQLQNDISLLQQPTESSSLAIATPPEIEQASLPALPPEEQQILMLAQRFGRVTAKDLVDSLNVSRATATRRLSALAEEGHLVQHGKGRGTYYTAAGYAVAETHSTATAPDKGATAVPGTVSTTATTAPDTEGILSRLSANNLQLRKQFAVEAIRPLISAPTKPMLRLTVRFATVPTLAEFWELRCHLQTLLGQEIDLIPEFPM
ncbi:MAG TPA: tetratricopeptide repeat protein [Caldilineaceae bacterium]|nr:tetratricopeptide repeat protein [Caldilineaceae bacterium]